LIYIQELKNTMLNKVLSDKDLKKGSSNRGVFLIIISLIIFMIFTYPLNLLVVSDYRSGEILKTWILKEDKFKVSYTHSVELTEVEEYYEINEGYIILKETIFRSYGAGLPATTKYDFEKTNDGFRIYNIKEKFKELIYRTGAVRADHRLFLNNEEYKFLDFSSPMQAVKFSSRKISFIRYLTRRL